MAYPVELEQPSTTSYDHTCRSYDPTCRRCRFIRICIILVLLLLPLLFVFILIVTILSSIFTTDPKFYVDNVTLTQFTISPTNNTLYYNLAVNMTFRNPSLRAGSNYHNIEAHATYHGHRFAVTKIQGFYLGHKSENNVNTVFKGEHLVRLGDLDEKLRYNQEQEAHIYDIVLYLNFKMKHKFLLENVNKYKVGCYLEVPMIPSSSAKFERTQCHLI